MNIGVSGVSFTIDGQPVTYAGLDAFRLLDRQLRAQHGIEPFDIAALLTDYQAVCAETAAFPFLRVLRVFGMAQSFMQLKPSDYPDYYSTVSFLSDYVQQYGFVIQWECLADCDQSGMTDVNARRRHVDAMAAAINGRAALGSLGNEWPKNGWSPSEHAKPAGSNMWTKGSNLGDSDPPLPAWDFSCYHGRRDGTKCALSGGDLAWASYGHEAPGGYWPGAHPVIMDEPIGFAETSKTGSRASNTQIAYCIGFNSRMFGAGGVYHSDVGVSTIPFAGYPVQREGALTWMMALTKADPVQSWNGSV